VGSDLFRKRRVSEEFSTFRERDHRIEEIRKIKKDILTLTHDELEKLNVDYVYELKDLAKVIFTIFS
jgi:hypothetical protein